MDKYIWVYHYFWWVMHPFIFFSFFFSFFNFIKLFNRKEPIINYLFKLGAKNKLHKNCLGRTNSKIDFIIRIWWDLNYVAYYTGGHIFNRLINVVQQIQQSTAGFIIAYRLHWKTTGKYVTSCTKQQKTDAPVSLRIFLSKKSL